MKEIGGFFELEVNKGALFHDDALAFNYGRACLHFLIKKNNIERIYLPYYLPQSIERECKRFGVEICYYSINFDFKPLGIDKHHTENEWLYLTNYYGYLNAEDIDTMKRFFENIIVDNTQAFFQKPVNGVNTLYSCRKFFGVPDGAFLYLNQDLDETFEFEQDKSYTRMSHLLGRLEEGANQFYPEYKKSEMEFENSPIMRMSKLTDNIMRGLDYKRIENKRTKNYCELDSKLKTINKISSKRVEGAFAYPLLIENGNKIRKHLIENKVYVPILWPHLCGEESSIPSFEKNLVSNLLVLPCDQRYDNNDMQFIVDKILEVV